MYHRLSTNSGLSRLWASLVLTDISPAVPSCKKIMYFQAIHAIPDTRYSYAMTFRTSKSQLFYNPHAYHHQYKGWKMVYINSQFIISLSISTLIF